MGNAVLYVMLVEVLVTPDAVIVKRKKRHLRLFGPAMNVNVLVMNVLVKVKYECVS